MHLEGILVEDQKQDTLLYAGDMKVNITDWFFLKKNIELKYVGLEDAIIKFQRTDSTWSQQFLFDYFSPSSGTVKADSKGEGIHLSIQKVELNRVMFIQKDMWMGQDLAIGLNNLTIDADNIDFNDKQIRLRSVDVDAPVVVLKEYDTPRSLLNTPDSIDTVSSWNPDGWLIHVNKLNITHGSFRDDKEKIARSSVISTAVTLTLKK